MKNELNGSEKRAYLYVSHLVRRGLPLLALTGALGAGYIYWRHAEHGPAIMTAAPKPNAIAVKVVEIAHETVPLKLRFLGKTEAAQLVELRARVAGYLQTRTFEEGSAITKGQKLFEIDSRPFEVDLAQAEAGLASARATLARATQQLARFQRLNEKGAVPAEEAENWQTQQQVAAASVQQQEALVTAAQLELDYATIESPIDGVIGKSLKDVGSYVDPNQNALLGVVQQVDPIYIRYSVTEQEMLRFKLQQDSGLINVPDIEDLELEVTLADGSTYPHRGRVNFVDVLIEETTGTSVVRGQVPNPEGLLKPGQLIYASILGVDQVNVIRVPQGAVVQSPAGASVLVANQENVAEMRPITLGDWSGSSEWIIKEGLNPGDRVIVDRLMMVRPGAAVTVAQRNGAPPEAEVNGEPVVTSAAIETKATQEVGAQR